MQELERAVIFNKIYQQSNNTLWKQCYLRDLVMLTNGKKVYNKKLPYLDLSYLRGKQKALIQESGYFVKKGELIILVDGHNAGEVFCVKEEGYLATTFKKLKIADIVKQEYLFIILQYFEDYLKHNKKGSAIPHLDKELFYKIVIPLPALKKQELLIQKINAIRSEIRQYLQLEEKLFVLDTAFIKQLKNGILSQAVQGKLSKKTRNKTNIDSLINEILNMKKEDKHNRKGRNQKASKIYQKNGKSYEEYENGEIKDITKEIPYNIPKSWRWSRLGNLGVTQVGKTPNTLKHEYFGKDIPFIKPGDIKDGAINYKNIGISRLGMDKMKRIDKNSIIMVCIGDSLGKCYYTDRIISCNQQINTITPYKMDYQYLYFVMSSPYFQRIMKKLATHTTKPIVNKINWNNILIPVPPIEEQKEIATKIKQIDIQLRKIIR